MIIIPMLISLSATLILEFIYTRILKYDISLRLLLAANLLTNPAVNLMYHIISSEIAVNTWAVKLPLEIGAVSAEYLIFRKYSDVKNPLACSVGMNAFSFFTGYIIQIIL